MLLDLILVFEGNHMNVVVDAADADKIVNGLTAAMRVPEVRQVPGTNAFFRSDKLIGFYFLDHMDRTPQQRVADALEKQLADGEGWKD